MDIDIDSSIPTFPLPCMARETCACIIIYLSLPPKNLLLPPPRHFLPDFLPHPGSNSTAAWNLLPHLFMYFGSLSLTFYTNNNLFYGTGRLGWCSGQLALNCWWQPLCTIGTSRKEKTKEQDNRKKAGRTRQNRQESGMAWQAWHDMLSSGLQGSATFSWGRRKEGRKMVKEEKLVCRVLTPASTIPLCSSSFFFLPLCSHLSLHTTLFLYCYSQLSCYYLSVPSH